MFSRIYSAAIVGVRALPVSVEADIRNGMPSFTMVGFLSTQVREAEERVRTAMYNAGISLPPKKITINLAPADLRKEGSRFDLPIAAAVLSAAGIALPDLTEDTMIAGELSISGDILPVTGILATVLLAKEQGLARVILPEGNLEEARLVSGIETVGVADIEELMAYMNGEILPQANEVHGERIVTEDTVDFAEILGQYPVKRAAMIAVAGFHNLLMVGPPGAGKTMIARRIPTILPPMSEEEQLEVAKIHSIAGSLRTEEGWHLVRPFRAPHHTISPQALAGGGIVPAPGEVTLSHRGVLFLDELPEFARQSLETLRQPLEDREIVIARTAGTFRFPADFLLVAAMNPCPCGYYPDRNRCTCSPSQISRYMHRVSRPLLDRIDLCVETPPVTYEALKGGESDAMSSGVMRKAVMDAVRMQQERYEGTGIRFNADVPASGIRTYCGMSSDAEELLEKAFRLLQLSARSYHRLCRVSRTVADLAGSPCIEKEHVEEALFYRSIDSSFRMEYVASPKDL